jgi:ribosomal protein L6P/L9E
MSRVGKKPVPLAKGVKLSIGEELLVEGPKGSAKATNTARCTA